MPSRTRLSALIVFLLPAAATAQSVDERLRAEVAPGQGLTSGEVARRAGDTSFELEAARAEIAAARAGVEQALAGYLPKLELSARYKRLSDIEQPAIGGISVPVILDQTTLSASLSVPLSDYALRVPAQVRAARASQAAAEHDAAATGRDVDTQARLLYYSWARARLTMTVSRQAVEQARAHLDDAGAAFKAGSANRADVLRAESALAQNELTLERAAASAELAEARVRQAMHDTAGGAYLIGEDVFADVDGASESLADLTARALARREELRAIDASLRALDAQRSVARASYLPRLDLVATAYAASPNQRYFPADDKLRGGWEAGAQLTYTPTDAAATRGKVRENEARARELRAQRAQLADAIELEVLSATEDLRQARAAVATAGKTLGTAEEAYRVRRALFRNGRATSLELSDAELDLTRASLDAVNARIDLRVALARLDDAAGAPVTSRR